MERARLQAAARRQIWGNSAARSAVLETLAKQAPGGGRVGAGVARPRSAPPRPARLAALSW